jgi:PAS domain S-box-containing protein
MVTPLTSSGNSTLWDNKFPCEVLIEALPIAIYTCNKDGIITFYNETAAKLWGRHPQINQDSWCGSWKIWRSDGITPFPLDECPMAIALQTGQKIQGIEIIIERPDGSRRHVLPHPQPLWDTHGNVTGAINMLVDITDTKTAEVQSAKLVAIVQSSDDAIIGKTLDGIVTSWNPGATRIFGYTADEMIGQSITKLIPRELIDEEPRILERLKKGERVEHFETKRKTKDGRILDISLTISPIKDKNDRITGASKIARDITEKKQALQLITESEEKFRMAIRSTNLGTWEYLPLQHKLIWSEECCKIFGVPVDIDMSYELFLQLIHPDDTEFVHQEVQNALQPGSTGNYDIQYRIIKQSDKQHRWVRAQGKTYFNNNQAIRFIGTALDITKEKQLEQRKDDFIKMASHELKTPITSIKGYVQLLLTIYDEMNEEKLLAAKGTIRTSLHTISKQVVKLTRLVTELLDLSRIESGKLEMNKIMFDLPTLVEETVQDARHTTSRHALIVNSEFEGAIYGDRDRISQVLLNLLTNAIKYSPDSEPIEIFIKGNDETVTVSVKDQGIGIDKKEHIKVFERFYRVEGKSEQTYPGFGIGLFIANEIVQRHSGFMTLQSEKGKGSTFNFTLPINSKS